MSRPAAFAAAALLTFAAGCGGGSGPSGSRGAPAPPFEVEKLWGGEVRLSDYRGKVVLLDFWATWCGPCRDSIPAFQSLYEKYGEEGLEVVGISVDADPAAVPRFVRERDMTYGVGLDPRNEVMERYGVRGIPSIFLLDKESKIRERWTGWDPSLVRVLDRRIAELLEEG